MAKLTREDVEQQIKWQRKYKGVVPSLDGADISGVDLNGINLIGVNLKWVEDISGATFSNANLIFAILEGMTLSGMDFSRANLGWVNLSGANLSGTNLSGANLNEANLSGANLSGANLYGTNLSRANLSGANLNGAYVAYTSFGDVNFSGVKGLDTMIHSGPSYIDTHTLYKSKGNIPPKFLKEVGVPDVIIKWHANLKNLPTVFICASHKDREDKDKLVNHLRVVGQEDLFTIWDYDDPEKVPAGSEWEKRIKTGLTQAKIGILFISKDLLTSKHFNELELPILLERNHQDEEDFTIFPVIAKGCAWNSVDWLKGLEVRPKGGKPIWSNGGDVDLELTKITEEVEKIIKGL